MLDFILLPWQMEDLAREAFGAIDFDYYVDAESVPGKICKEIISFSMEEWLQHVDVWSVSNFPKGRLCNSINRALAGCGGELSSAKKFQDNCNHVSSNYCSQRIAVGAITPTM